MPDPYGASGDLPGTCPVHVLGRAVRKRCVRWQRRIPRDRGQ